MITLLTDPTQVVGKKESAAAKPAKGIIFKLKNNEKKIFCTLDGCCGVGLVCLRWVSHL